MKSGELPTFDADKTYKQTIFIAKDPLLQKNVVENLEQFFYLNIGKVQPEDYIVIACYFPKIRFGGSP